MRNKVLFALVGAGLATGIASAIIYSRQRPAEPPVFEEEEPSEHAASSVEPARTKKMRMKERMGPPKISATVMKKPPGAKQLNW